MTAVQTNPSRRTVLRAAGGLGAGALLAGCTAQAPPTPPMSSVTLAGRGTGIGGSQQWSSVQLGARWVHPDGGQRSISA